MYTCNVCLYIDLQFRDLLDTWGKYLNKSLPDPKNQLCTDDFEGKSPHNSNLAVKVCVPHFVILAHSYFLHAKYETRPCVHVYFL